MAAVQSQQYIEHAESGRAQRQSEPILGSTDRGRDRISSQQFGVPRGPAAGRRYLHFQ